jgi:hypothetical protein
MQIRLIIAFGFFRLTQNAPVFSFENFTKDDSPLFSVSSCCSPMLKKLLHSSVTSTAQFPVALKNVSAQSLDGAADMFLILLQLSSTVSVNTKADAGRTVHTSELLTLF